MKPTTYEIVPAEVFVPAMPLPDDKWLGGRIDGRYSHFSASRTIQARGAITAPTTIAGAVATSKGLFRQFYRAIHDRDRATVWTMLVDRPELALLPEVCELLTQWARAGTLRAARGRPRDTGAWSPLVVAGLVNHLVSRGRAPSREQGLRMLDVFGLCYETAKRLYGQALREPRFRPIIVLDEERARPLRDEDRRWMAGAEVLQSGKPVTRSLHDPRLGGAVNIQFAAID